MKKSTGGGNKRDRLVLALLFLCAAYPVRAGEFGYGIGYTATRSDNIERVPPNADERSDTINAYLFAFSYLENSSNLLARVLAQAEFRDYREEIFGDETVYNLKSSLVWTLSPQRFTWTVEDTYDETQITPTVADTPANRTNVNVFSTGPDFYIRLNPVHTLALGARLGNVYTGRANTDNDRVSGSARWLYQSTAITTYSLNFDTLKVNYENSALNNYLNHNVFLGVDYRPSRSQYLVDLGVTRFDPDRGETLDEMLVRLSWIRHLTPESRLGVSASGEFLDTGADLLEASTSSVPLATQTAGVVTSDVYYTRRGSIFYIRQGSQLVIDVSLFSQELDFEILPEDRKENGGQLKLDILYSGTTTVTLIGKQTRSDYLNFVRRDTDSDVAIRLGYRLTRSVNLGLEGRRLSRSSTVSAGEFDENRVLLSLLYSNPFFNTVAAR
jgi:hypothetical protein